MELNVSDSSEWVQADAQRIHQLYYSNGEKSLWLLIKWGKVLPFRGREGKYYNSRIWEITHLNRESDLQTQEKCSGQRTGKRQNYQWLPEST